MKSDLVLIAIVMREIVLMTEYNEHRGFTLLYTN